MDIIHGILLLTQGRGHIRMNHFYGYSDAVMNGVEATERIRRGEAGEDKVDVPIIAMTAYVMIGDKEKFAAAGMEGYLAKPFEMDELKMVIEKTMAKKQG